MKKDIFKLEESVMENTYAYCIEDAFPVSEGHMLVIPKRDVTDINQLSALEIQDCFSLICSAMAQLNGEDMYEGFNIGINIGECAGQTVEQLHIHIIPRTLGDVEDPTGGIRNVIPHKGNWKYNKPANHSTYQTRIKGLHSRRYG